MCISPITHALSDTSNHKSALTAKFGSQRTLPPTPLIGL